MILARVKCDKTGKPALLSMNPEILVCRGVAKYESCFHLDRARSPADGITQRFVPGEEINDRSRKYQPLAAPLSLSGCGRPPLAGLSGSVNDFGEDLLLLQVGDDLLLKLSVLAGGEFGQVWIVLERDLLDYDRVVLRQKLAGFRLRCEG